ncbi:MAG: hypothetical protein A3K19_05640 [Lentisphaerae bacterium RIFOXYB12_FULL_65_16]|nr:MAG: hypothetical protein A3K18_23680 [Lentisphaerae bacterium RIFOXYA12_64_32]OGV94392.1 MAG: hypothetical protein A3K19_05640 [Lentisphaerae bacterium RIFOXYB12_FULL_65_16]
MTSRERFRQTMRFGTPDRAPYFDDGMRDGVLEAWRRQGLPADATLPTFFGLDAREEIAPDLEPRPKPERWPTTLAGLEELHQRLDPYDPGRLPADWPERVRACRTGSQTLMLWAHRGFFLTLGVHDWARFAEVMYLCADDPEFVCRAMAMQGEFAAAMAERVLREVHVGAAIFSEPIGGNDRPLISPRMYEEFVLPGYRPVLDVLARHGVETLIVRTYANARPLVPSMLNAGFNCLWVSEANSDAMDYLSLRREFGPRLRLIGGISLDVIRRGGTALRREVERVVPPLLAQGGYVPMASGRIREDVPFRNYVAYRQLLTEVTGGTA